MRLSMHIADTAYISCLRTFDYRVPITDKCDGTRLRPLIGIVLDINGLKFYAPLSSPKKKHLMMKDLQDIVKIDGGVLGVINLNNMVPISDSNVVEVDIANFPILSQDDIDYKNLLIDQLTWCNIVINKNNIINKATKLYNVILAGKSRPELIARCCDFDLLTKICKTYTKI